jgi:integrase
MASAEKRSKKSWTARWRDIDGVPQYKAGFATKQEAKAHGENQEYLVRQGKRTGTTRMNMTLNDFCRDVWKGTLDVKKSTRLDYQRALRSHILPKFGDRVMADISRADLQTWSNELKAKKILKGTTITKHLNLLAAIFKVAVDNEYLHKSPFTGWKRTKPVSSKKVTPLTKKQVDEIASHISERFRLMVWVGYWTGMRPSEVLGLTWEQLDFENGTIDVDRQLSRDPNLIHDAELKTKNSVRTVAFPKVLQGLIRTHVAKFGLGPSNLIMTNRVGKAFRYKDAIVHFRKAARAVGLQPGEGMHQLRHTYVSTCISLGLNMKQIQSLVGHASITETMDTYGHLFPDAIDEVNLRLDAFAEESDAKARKELFELYNESSIEA